MAVLENMNLLLNIDDWDKMFDYDPYFNRIPLGKFREQIISKTYILNNFLIIILAFQNWDHL